MKHHVTLVGEEMTKLHVLTIHHSFLSTFLNLLQLSHVDSMIVCQRQLANTRTAHTDLNELLQKRDNSVVSKLTKNLLASSSLFGPVIIESI